MARDLECFSALEAQADPFRKCVWIRSVCATACDMYDWYDWVSTANCTLPRHSMANCMGLKKLHMQDPARMIFSHTDDR